MADVHLARESALRRLVAVKVLKPEAGADEAARARFEREAHAAAGINHSAVPSIYRVGRLESGLPYMVQEYVEGRTLRDRLEALGAVGAPEARTVLADVAGALAAAHREGVIHRDVRPENILIRKETGRAVLLDFGLVAVRETGVGASPRLTRTGEILGDPHYSSPEQLRGEPVTAETDVYSLGVLGHEILTGSNPFDAESEAELVTGHLSREPRKLPWSVVGADPELGKLLESCLHKEPSRRPRARELERSLERDPSREGGRGSGPTGSVHPALRPFPRLAAFVEELRRRRVYQVAAGYVVAVFVVLEAADLVLEGLDAPDWLFSALVIASLGGFPVALVLAWIFDLTRGGLRRTSSPDASTSASGPGRVLKLLGVAVSVAVAGVVGWLILR